MLFLTGAKDEMIPPAHSRALHGNATKSPLRRIEVFEEGMHNDTWEKGGEKYWDAWTAFLKEPGVQQTPTPYPSCRTPSREFMCCTGAVLRLPLRLIVVRLQSARPWHWPHGLSRGSSNHEVLGR